MKRDLRQTKQRVEHLSSKNKHLSNELEKERRHNVNLSRKLGVSESSLTEVRQHNERLTSALTQASQRNEQLSNKLEQESQRNANLERKLEISGYSGYPALLDGIYSAKQLRTDSQKDPISKITRSCHRVMARISKFRHFARLLKTGLSRSIFAMLLFTLLSTCPLSSQSVWF